MNKKHMRWGWFFVSPYLISLFVFTLFALFYSGYLSFTRYDGFNPPVWVGLDNYIEAFNAKEVWQGFRNVFTYAIIFVTLEIFLGCILATLLNHKIKGMSFFRSVYFLPVLTPMVAVCFVWISLYNPTYGILNYILSFFGIAPFSYVFSSNWFEVIFWIAIMNVWKNVGYITIYLLAGMQNISEDVMEAALIDGAGPVKKFFKVTLPLLSPTIFFLVTMGIINAMQAFDQFYIIKSYIAEGTGPNLDVIGTLVYFNAFKYGRLGYASAIGFMATIIIAALTFIQKKMEKKWVYYA